MNEQLVVSTEELFVLSQSMKAKYLDYDYIAKMDDIMQKRSLKKRKILAELEKRGILEEDFMGDIEMSNEVKSLLEPIFFGEAESDMCRGNTIHKFHFYKDEVTYVKLKQNELTISKGSREVVEKLAKLLAPVTYEKEQEIVLKKALRADMVEETVTLRNVVVGKNANAIELSKINGAWYVGLDKENSLVLDGESVKKICRQLLWEE